MQISPQQTIYSVSKLNQTVKELLQCHFLQVWVKGEISNLTKAASGHWYFKLKDKKAQVQCAMFKRANQAIRTNIKEGDEVLIRASVSLYEARGDFQLIAEMMEPAGEGLLKQEFEKLKFKLAAEGLFAEQNKKSLPTQIAKIGVVTSPTGAAIHDIISVMKRRAPSCPIIIYPSLVQGEQAHHNIITAIHTANQRKEVDVLIVGRGGGSIEDLWCFNNQELAYTIANSKIPIISAVGHEVDFTIADFTADLRAATPSAAAEIISSIVLSGQQQLSVYHHQLITIVKQQLQMHYHRLHYLHNRLIKLDPKHQLISQAQKLDEIRFGLINTLNKKCQFHHQHLINLTARLKQQHPMHKLPQAKLQLEVLTQQLKQQIKLRQQYFQQRLALLAGQLNAYSPLATLSRGYVIPLDDAEQHVIKSIKQIRPKDKIKLKFNDGLISCQVIELK